MKPLATLFVLAAVCLFPFSADSANTCVVACTSLMGGGKTCMVHLINVTYGPCYVPGVKGTVAHGTSNASCLVGAIGDFMATAIHTVGNGYPAKCEFSFGFICYGPPGPVNFADCTVDSAGDGLPVELMAFSVE